MFKNKKEEAKALEKLTRITDYIAASQIFLADNFFLERELKKEDIKKRLLGHWGTCPGANFVIAQINRQISKKEFLKSELEKENKILKDDRDFIFVDGPGHGFPAYQANTMIEGSLSYFYSEKYVKENTVEIENKYKNSRYFLENKFLENNDLVEDEKEEKIENLISNYLKNIKKIPYTREGLSKVIKNFSTPYGYPSHINPESPGSIIEGGELGYSLAASAGAVLDNKNLISVTLVGDGESETGPLAASWNFNKFLSPKSDGVVLPILHLNGYKISGPTIFGRMNDSEIKSYFKGLGYKVYFIDYFKKKNLHIQGMEIFDKAVARIKKIQEKARKGEEVLKPKWPIIILKTPKGYGAPDFINGRKIVGNCEAHQVVFDDLKSEKQIKMLENWLRSYKIEEIISFDENENIILAEDVKKIIPKIEKTLGYSKIANGGIEKKVSTENSEKNENSEKYFKIPDFNKIFTEQEISKELTKTKTENSMYEVGKYFKELVKENNDFRIFSPDETYSNRLFEIFKETKRVWQLPIKSFDKDMGREGKVIELISEHLLFGMLWGYVLSGRFGFFITYEAFAQITASMTDQYIKFIKVARNVHFRKNTPSINVILSSLLERQDHNGFSHQNPSYISAALDKDSDIVNVYFPADKNLAKLAIEKSLKSKNSFNISVIGKKMTRTWLSKEEAKKQAEDEIMKWEFISDDNPNIVVCTCGDYITEESIAGVLIFKELFPQINIRFVNIFKLDVLVEKRGKFKKEEIIEKFLTKDKQIIFNYHGYKTDIKKLLFEYDLSKRITINGYEEFGSTTSAFDLKARNGLSRYNLVIDLLEAAFVERQISEVELVEMTERFEKKLQNEKKYIIENKVDPDYIKKWDFDNLPS